MSAVAGELQAPPVKVTLAAAQTTDLTVSPTPRSSAEPAQSASPVPTNIQFYRYFSFVFCHLRPEANLPLRKKLKKDEIDRCWFSI